MTSGIESFGLACAVAESAQIAANVQETATAARNMTVTLDRLGERDASLAKSQAECDLTSKYWFQSIRRCRCRKFVNQGSLAAHALEPLRVTGMVTGLRPNHGIEACQAYGRYARQRRRLGQVKQSSDHRSQYFLFGEA